MAECAIVLMSFISSNSYFKATYTILIIIDICIFYDNMVDIEQFFYIVY